MDEGVKFLAWIILTILTIGVGAGLDLWVVSVVSSLVIAAIWAVSIWGGILILDDLDGIF
jgi:hypothetical protein